MARAKSTPGGKISANTTTNTNNKDQTNASTPASVPQVREEVQANVQSVPAETAPVKPEVRVVAEPRKKLEVVRTTESRRVIPINMEDEIRRRAYELYQQRGAKPGSEAEDWLSAEREVRQRYHKQQSA